MSSESRQRKGHYGSSKLPVARSYPRMANRWTMLALGLLVGGIALAVAIWDTTLGGGTVLSGGPVSSAHAAFEQDCSSCHIGFRKVSDDACATCHEKANDPVGTFTFASHAIYRSGDFQRVQEHDDALSCASCHAEHRGRESDVIDVPDSVCATCHESSDFDTDHPDFAFTNNPEGDDDAITFAHGPHVREVMERGGWADLERACLACHQPTADGRQFEPIDFDRHCDACHLDAGVATSRLPVATADRTEPAVWTLDAIRASGLPGTDWAFSMNPGELRGGGARVVKTPLHHEDPWVLWNLRQLRRMRFPNAGLADFLRATPDVDKAGVRALYEEMTEVLERQAVGLRGTASPEVQEQLAAIEKQLTAIREALRDPATPLDESSLALALTEPVDMPAETLEAWQEVVDGLTTPCLTCHRIESATIARVHEDQRSMPRAEFDHGAHVIQRRCLDCHGELPILEALSSDGEATSWQPADDHAGIYNLPRIAVCQECHQKGQVASRCIDCHAYHPDKDRHADFLLYLE